MANEITTSISLLASKGGASVNSVGSATTTAAAKSWSMTGNGMGTTVQTLPTATTTLLSVPGSISGYFRILVRNMDAALYVDLSYDNASAQIWCRVFPGEAVIWHAPDKTKIYGKPTGGADVDIAITCVED